MNARPERVFFTDRDLGIRFGDILSDAGIRIERLRDHFSRIALMKSGCRKSVHAAGLRSHTTAEFATLRTNSLRSCSTGSRCWW